MWTNPGNDMSSTAISVTWLAYDWFLKQNWKYTSEIINLPLTLSAMVGETKELSHLWETNPYTSYSKQTRTVIVCLGYYVHS